MREQRGSLQKGSVEEPEARVCEGPRGTGGPRVWLDSFPHPNAPGDQNPESVGLWCPAKLFLRADLCPRGLQSPSAPHSSGRLRGLGARGQSLHPERWELRPEGLAQAAE